jgi:hypothetical protein
MPLCLFIRLYICSSGHEQPYDLMCTSLGPIPELQSLGTLASDAKLLDERQVGFTVFLGYVL